MAFFGVASFLAAIGSFLIFISAKSAIHEILGVALGLVSAIFGVGSVVVSQLTELPRRIAQAIAEEEQRQRATVLPTADTLDERRRLAQESGTALSVKIIAGFLILCALAVIYAWYHQR